MQDAGGDISRNEYLFHHLVAMFQTLALQQLGKLINPVTGKMERDLQQARITIDMLHMIKEKTAGNLSGRERGLLDGVLTDLQLNYVDELKREEEKPAAESAAGAQEEQAGGATEGEEKEEPAPAFEEAGSAAAEAGPHPSREKAKKRTAKTKKRTAKAKKPKSAPESGN